MDPPPKNGGAPCPGASQERAPCGLQPCKGGTGKGAGLGGGIQGWSPMEVGLLGKVTGLLVPAPPRLHPVSLPPDCGLGRVLISAELCQKGLVPPCPPSCWDPEANRTCSGHCLEGEAHPASRDVADRALGGGGCSPALRLRPPLPTAPLHGTECPPTSTPGCRCPPGLLLYDGRCLPLSECPCLVGEELKQPGVPFLLDNCSHW